MSGRKIDGQKAFDTNNIKTKTNSDLIELKKGLVEKMKEVATFLEGAPVYNKESITNLIQHYDNFMVSLKYFPTGNSFSDLPTEIKTTILDYLCDDGAIIAASVCQEWKVILNKRVNRNMGEIVIGRHCENWQKDKCFNPEEMLKASLVLKLDIPLKVCYPVEEVNSQLLAKALTSTSAFTLDDTCKCGTKFVGFGVKKAILTEEQGEELMKALEMKAEPMEKVVLMGLDLTYLKDRMLRCLLKKVKTLTLTGITHNHRLPAKVLNFSALMKKLRQTSTGRKLECLNLYFEYNGRLDDTLLADALCTVEKIDIGDNFRISDTTAKRLIENMITGVTMKTLLVRKLKNWGSLISATELRKALSNMEKVRLDGEFSAEQLEVARSLPGGYAEEIDPDLFWYHRLGIN